MKTTTKQIRLANAAAVCAVMLAGSFAACAQESAVVKSGQISETLGKDLVLDSPVDADGYTSPEASPQVGLTTILFDLDSARLRPESAAQLDEVVAALKSLGFGRDKDLILAPDGQPQEKMLIEGHTCDLGTDEHNLKLSSDRAVAVRDYLMDHGVRDEVLSTRGLGEARPVAPNTDAERAQNRRVVFVRRVHGSAEQETGRELLESTEARRRALDVRFAAKALSENGKEYADDAIRVLRTGDKFRVRFTAQRGSYAYVLVRSASERVVCLFPPESAPKGLWLNPGDTWELPGKGADDWFTLDEKTGQEVVCVIATPKPIENPQRVTDLLVRAGNTLTAATLEQEGGVEKPELHMLVIDHQPLQQ